uniref:Uncharacterized protein n=1 Tax=Rhizophagus irregularis (strain DAOM 181602 / DAOM 197198 / MUCL 43194) TaxID=747089 RepID=U9TID7_RHIID
MTTKNTSSEMANILSHNTEKIRSLNGQDLSIKIFNFSIKINHVLNLMSDSHAPRDYLFISNSP